MAKGTERAGWHYRGQERTAIRQGAPGAKTATPFPNKPVRPRLACRYATFVPMNHCIRKDPPTMPRTRRLTALAASCTLLAAALAAAPHGALADNLVVPLGPLDASAYDMDGQSLRLKTVKQGGAIDDSGARARDEILGIQVDSRIKMFTNAKETLHYFGEALDLATGRGGSFRMQMRLGRDAGPASVNVPKMGSFIPGYVIDKTTVDGKENKNEILMKRASRWLAKHQAADGRLPGNPTYLALAGLAWMNSPDPAHQKSLALTVQYFEQALAKDLTIQMCPAFYSAYEDLDPDKGIAGPHAYGWAVLLLSEYNWRHPDSARTALLQKACDEMVECNFNPTYKFKAPLPKWAEDPYYKDREFPDKAHQKGRLDFNHHQKKGTFDWELALGGTRGTSDPKVLDASDCIPGDLGMALWCWTHCATTSGVKTNPEAIKTACLFAQALAAGKDAKGGAAGLSAESAAYYAQALMASDKPGLAALGKTMAAKALQAWAEQEKRERAPTLPPAKPKTGDKEADKKSQPAAVESGIEATDTAIACMVPLVLRTQGVAGYKSNFPCWRWYLSLMMQSNGEAEQVPFVGEAYLYGACAGEGKGKHLLASQDGDGAAARANANAMCAYLMAMPARQLLMTGAAAPSKIDAGGEYHLGGANAPSPGAPPAGK